MVKVKSFKINEKLYSYIEKKLESEWNDNGLMNSYEKNQKKIEHPNQELAMKKSQYQSVWQLRNKQGYKHRNSLLKYSFTPETLINSTNNEKSSQNNNGSNNINSTSKKSKSIFSSLTKKLKVNQKSSKSTKNHKNSKLFGTSNSSMLLKKSNKVSRLNNNESSSTNLKTITKQKSLKEKYIAYGINVSTIPLQVIESLYTLSFSKHSYYIQRSLRTSTMIVNLISNFRNMYDELQEIETPKLKRRISFKKRIQNKQVKKIEQPSQGSLIDLREERKAKYFEIFGDTKPYGSRHKKSKIPKKPLLDFSDCTTLPTIPPTSAGSLINNYIGKKNNENSVKKLKPIKSLDEELCNIFNKKYTYDNEKDDLNSGKEKNKNDDVDDDDDDDDNEIIGNIKLNKELKQKELERKRAKNNEQNKIKEKENFNNGNSLDNNGNETIYLKRKENKSSCKGNNYSENSLTSPSLSSTSPYPTNDGCDKEKIKSTKRNSIIQLEDSFLLNGNDCSSLELSKETLSLLLNLNENENKEKISNNNNNNDKKNAINDESSSIFNDTLSFFSEENNLYSSTTATIQSSNDDKKNEKLLSNIPNQTTMNINNNNLSNKQSNLNIKHKNFNNNVNNINNNYNNQQQQQHLSNNDNSKLSDFNNDGDNWADSTIELTSLIFSESKSEFIANKKDKRNKNNLTLDTSKIQKQQQQQNEVNNKSNSKSKSTLLRIDSGIELNLMDELLQLSNSN